MNKKRVLVVLVITALFLKLVPHATYAQVTPTPTPFLFRTESKIWQTIVGNPPSGTRGPRHEVRGWAEQITNALQIGVNCGGRLYNRMLASITNDKGYYATQRAAARCAETDYPGIYWCTYLVIDAYNLTGFQGFTTARHGAVSGLATAWRLLAQSSSEYQYLDYIKDNKIILSVRPGFAVFFQREPFVFGNLDHTAIVKDIDINSIGDGEMSTYDSNNARVIIDSYIFDDFVLQNPPNKASGTRLTGFGG